MPIELIENGSFEEGRQEGGLMLTGWSDARSGVNNRGLSVGEYNFLFGGEPQEVDFLYDYPADMPPDFTGTPRPEGAGRYFGRRWGRGNGDGLSGSATQHVDLTPYADRPYQFSAWLASRPTPSTDFGIVSLEFFTGPDATGESLGSTIFDGNDQQSPYIVGSLNIAGFADPDIPATRANWTLYRGEGVVPSLAASAAVLIRSATLTSNADDGYVDLVSLQVIPEPSGILLAGILLPLAICWAARRRRRAGA